jgi:hypothetical protein
MPSCHGCCYLWISRKDETIEIQTARYSLVYDTEESKLQALV